MTPGDPLAALRAQVATVCRTLAEAGVVPGTAGNVSAREGDLVRFPSD